MWLTVTLLYYWDNTFDEKCEDLADDSIQSRYPMCIGILSSHEIMLSDSVHKLAFLSIQICGEPVSV